MGDTRTIKADPVPTPEPNPVPTPDPIPNPTPTPTPDPTPEPTPTPDPGDGGGGGGSKDKVNPKVIDALTISMLTTTASSASFAMANLYQHQINHARRLDSMAEACHAKFLKKFATTSPEEAIATSKLFQGEADSSIASLLAQLSAGQEGAKIAQSTPGDLAVEISKIGAAVTSVQGLMGGLLALLKVLNESAGNTSAILSRKANPSPIPPPPAPEDHEIELKPEIEIPDWPPDKKFPKVTIRY